MKTHIILLITLAYPVLGFDYIEKALSLIDKTKNPCNDFYRHACPLGSPDYAPSAFIDEVVKNVLENNTDSVLNKIEILVDHSSLQGEISLDNLFSNVYKELCAAGGNTSLFLSQFEAFMLSGPECVYPFCVVHLSKDSNCERVTSQLKDLHPEFDAYLARAKRPSVGGRLKNIYLNLEIYKLNLLVLELHVKGNIQNAVSELRSFLSEMKEIIAQMIEETPWARSNNVTDLIEDVAAKIHLTETPQAVYDETLANVTELNQKYTNCKNNLAPVNEQSVIIFCLLYVQHSMKVNAIYDENFSVDSAFTVYPQISLGFIWYYMMQNSDNIAFKLGAPGFPLAHELSHALIKSTSYDILTYFSDTASKCIKDQYSEFCLEYREKSCEIRDDMADDNGADVLGLEIALTLLHRKFANDELRDTYKETDIQLNQLFFYSAAMSFCSGRKTYSDPRDPHAPLNVRVNAFANHPDFQEAFKCEASSRMMSTKTQHCSIYGKDAPAQRRRLAPNWISKI